jgi:gliding motility-associated-like protein
MEKHKCLIRSHIFIQLRLFCLIVFILFVSKITEAQSVTIGAGTTSSYLYGPYYRSSAASNINYSKYCYLYTASELGIPSGAIITKIEWQKASGTLSAPNTFQILLKNSTSTSLTSGSSWSSLSIGASSVYNSSNQAFLLSSGWESFTLTSAFTYIGGSLVVLTDHVKSGTASAANNYNTTAGAGMSLGTASSSPLTSSSALSSTTYGGNRPNIRITFTNCPSIPAPTSVTSATICQSGQLATISATPSSGGNTILWYSSSTGGTALASGLNYSANYSITTTMYAATYNSSTTCQSATRTPVTVTLNSLSAPTSVTSATICQSGQSATISATPSSGGNTILWYAASTGGTALASGINYIANYSTTTTRYAATYNSLNACQSVTRTPVTVILGSLSAPTSVTSATICQSGQSATISATPSSGGNTILWYSASSGGTALTSGINYIANYSTTTTRYAATYNSSNACQSVIRTPVTVILSSLSAPTSVTSATICQPGNATLTATPASGANTIKWYTSSAGGSYLGTATNFVNYYSSTTTRYASSYNSANGCESSSRLGANVIISVLQNPSTVYDTTICQAGIAGVKAIPSSGANSILWYNVASGGSILSSGLTYSSFVNQSTIFYAASYNTTSSCASTIRTPVKINIEPLKITYLKISTNNIDSNSVLVTVSNGLAPYFYDWSIDGSGDFDDAKDQYDLPPGRYILYAKDSQGCENNISIDIYKEIMIPTGISPDGDGINDTWNIIGWEQYKDIEIRVTNILGQVIHFQKGTYIPWDGKLDGKTITKGEYFFQISSSNSKLYETGMLVIKY